MPYKDREKQLTYKRIQYQRNKINGICHRCGGKAQQGYIHCLKCSFVQNQKGKEWRLLNVGHSKEYHHNKYYKLKREGKCTVCGYPLEDNVGKTRCMSCEATRFSPSYFKKGVYRGE